ncbi:iron transporter FeoA [Clostridium botulinum C str. Stockholm]|nr:iron transporter FeoA [Clostridium botulinum C str. Stockholm]
MSILDLRPGEMGFIEHIHGDEKLSRRLLALGCIEGTGVTFKTSAPLGDPIIISVRGFDLAIRKKMLKTLL